MWASCSNDSFFRHSSVWKSAYRYACTASEILSSPKSYAKTILFVYIFAFLLCTYKYLSVFIFSIYIQKWTRMRELVTYGCIAVVRDFFSVSWLLSLFAQFRVAAVVLVFSRFIRHAICHSYAKCQPFKAWETIISHNKENDDLLLPPPPLNRFFSLNSPTYARRCTRR